MPQAPPSMRRKNGDEFIVTVNGEELAFDRICLCTGKSNEPIVPDVPVRGATTFHTLDFRAHQVEAMRGRHVIIFGFGQASAGDVCELAAQCAKSVTIVCEQPIFLLPRSNLTIPVAACLATPEMREKLLRQKLFRFPRHTEGEEFISGRHYISICWMLHELLDAGKVALQLGSLQSVCDGVATLCDGNQLPADVVVWGTGYRSTILDVLDAPLLAQVLHSVPLYETIWTPNVPGLAVMGQGYSFFWLLQLQAQWISAVWAGRVRLPPPAAMNKWIAAIAHRRDVVQGKKRRKKAYLLPGHPLDFGLRISKHIGGWPGRLWISWHRQRVFEPRDLFASRPLRRWSSPSFLIGVATMSLLAFVVIKRRPFPLLVGLRAQPR